jgi:hypothetical protein
MGPLSPEIDPVARGLATGASSPSQKPQELPGVQPVTAHNRAVEEQDWDVQTMAAQQLRIGIDVHDGGGGQLDPSPESFQLSDHLIAQIAVLPVHHGQPGLGCRVLIGNRDQAQ